METTLGTRLSRRDRDRLVGRTAELETFDGLFVDEPRANVVLLHGPGGIGKSTLLREVARRGEQHGWRATLVDGRELHSTPEAIEAALGPVRDEPRPLLLFDSYERMSAMDGYLRGGLLPSLPERAIVVLAGRGRPGRGWTEDGWDSLAVELELGPLSDREAAELLRRSGVSDERVARELVVWADGSPLALSLAADAASGPGIWTPHNALERPRIVEALIRRLADAEIDAAHPGVLAVAAIARVTTRDMLRDVLPELDVEDAYGWLASRSFTEPLGQGLSLHDLVRKALAADLRRRDPERERLLRRRIADHLHERAIDRDVLLSIDLAHLVESDTIRWGYSWEGNGRHRIDDLRPGDAEAIAELLLRGGHEGLYADARRFFEEAPGRVAVARDADDRLCGYQICVTPTNAPPFANDHPLLGPWLADARSRSSEAILWSESVDFTGDPRSRVQALLGMAGILRSGLDNPRLAYMPINPRVPGALAFSEALGAAHVEELDREVAGVWIECHLLDYGPGGLLGAQRDVVYRELGLEPPGQSAPRSPEIDEPQVREALRNLGSPHKLARSPLGRGEGIAERAAYVRGLIEDARERAFGDTHEERLLKQVLERGYLEPAASHEAAADELHLSRSAYFRRLKAASQRVAEHLNARSAG